MRFSLPITVVGSVIVSVVIGLASYFGSINTQAAALAVVDTKVQVLDTKQVYTEERLKRIEDKIDALLKYGGIDLNSLTKK